MKLAKWINLFAAIPALTGVYLFFQSGIVNSLVGLMTGAKLPGISLRNMNADGGQNRILGNPLTGTKIDERTSPVHHQPRSNATRSPYDRGNAYKDDSTTANKGMKNGTQASRGQGINSTAIPAHSSSVRTTQKPSKTAQQSRVDNPVIEPTSKPPKTSSKSPTKARGRTNATLTKDSSSTKKDSKMTSPSPVKFKATTKLTLIPGINNDEQENRNNKKEKECQRIMDEQNKKVHSKATDKPNGKPTQKNRRRKPKRIGRSAKQKGKKYTVKHCKTFLRARAKKNREEKKSNDEAIRSEKLSFIQGVGGSREGQELFTEAFKSFSYSRADFDSEQYSSPIEFFKEALGAKEDLGTEARSHNKQSQKSNGMHKPKLRPKLGKGKINAALRILKSVAQSKFRKLKYAGKFAVRAIELVNTVGGAISDASSGSELLVDSGLALYEAVEGTIDFLIEKGIDFAVGNVKRNINAFKSIVGALSSSGKDTKQHKTTSSLATHDLPVDDKQDNNSTANAYFTPMAPTNFSIETNITKETNETATTSATMYTTTLIGTNISTTETPCENVTGFAFLENNGTEVSNITNSCFSIPATTSFNGLQTNETEFALVEGNHTEEYQSTIDYAEQDFNSTFLDSRNNTAFSKLPETSEIDNYDLQLNGTKFDLSERNSTEVLHGTTESIEQTLYDTFSNLTNNTSNPLQLGTSGIDPFDLQNNGTEFDLSKSNGAGVAHITTDFARLSVNATFSDLKNNTSNPLQPKTSKIDSYDLQTNKTELYASRMNQSDTANEILQDISLFANGIYYSDLRNVSTEGIGSSNNSTITDDENPESNYVVLEIDKPDILGLACNVVSSLKNGEDIEAGSAYKNLLDLHVKKEVEGKEFSKIALSIIKKFKEQQNQRLKVLEKQFDEKWLEIRNRTLEENLKAYQMTLKIMIPIVVKRIPEEKQIPLLERFKSESSAAIEDLMKELDEAIVNLKQMYKVEYLSDRNERAILFKQCFLMSQIQEESAKTDIFKEKQSYDGKRTDGYVLGEDLVKIDEFFDKCADISVEYDDSG